MDELKVAKIQLGCAVLQVVLLFIILVLVFVAAPKYKAKTKNIRNQATSVEAEILKI